MEDTAKRLIRSRLDQELVERVRSSAIGHTLIVVLLTLAASKMGIIDGAFVGYGVALVVLSFVRVLVGLSLHKYFTGLRNLWFSLFSLSLLAMGVAWGLFVYRLIDQLGLGHPISLLGIFVVTGMLSGSTSSLSPAPVLFLPFMLAAMGIPFGLFAASSQGNFAFWLLGLFVLYLYFLYRQTAYQYRVLVKGIESELAASDKSERLQSLVDTVPGVVVWVDHDARYQMMNKALLDRSGLAAEDIVGKTLGFGIKNPNYVRTVREFLKSDRLEESQELEIAIGRSPTRWYLLCMRKVGADPQGAVLLALDIHEAKLVQDELQLQKGKAEYSAKLATLGEMAAGIAHEINNPLAIIKGYTFQIQHQLKGGHPDVAKITTFTEKIDTTVERISKIILGLRTFAREDETREERQLVSVTKLIEDTLELSAQRLRYHDVRVIVDSNDRLQVMCAPVQVSQVLLNLISNAFDAIRNLPDKWIRIKASKNANDQIEIRVSDSGTGIPIELRSKIMEPFFTTKPVGEGTGLGLSISKSIVEAHGGKFVLDHESKQTCFVMTFAAAPAEPPQK